MNAQATLFDAPPTAAPSRRSDPVTSKMAGKALPLRVRQQEVVHALRWIGVSATADDVKQCLAEHGLQRERNEVASRLSELADPERWPQGPLVRRVGVRPNQKGRNVATFALTEQGRAAA